MSPAPEALDFYYDVVCPYAYLASTRVEAVARRAGVPLRLRPVLLGGLLRTVGAPDDPNQVMAAAKATLCADDRRNWAAWLGVPLHPPAGHPRRSVEAMRLALAAPPGPVRRAVTHDLFAAYWVRGQDITQDEVLAEVAQRHGLAPDAHRASHLRAGLRQATADAAAAGAFGVPSFGVGSTLWWGQDRLPLVEHALGLAASTPGPVATKTPAPGASTVTFFHDFASPFSYLAATQVQRVAAARGVEVALVPILLGALFRSIGTPDVPLFEMNQVKQAYVRRDLDDWARWWGVPLRFPSHFPLRSVLPLRVAACEPAATDAIYRAAWVDDRRIDTPEALGPVLEEAGLPGPRLLSQATTAPVKAQLRANTERALAVGACGVPSFRVERQGRSLLLWGQDRLDMLGAILDGWWPPES